MAPTSRSKLLQELSKIDSSKFEAVAAVACLPAIGLALILGISFHRPATGIVVASGALSIGFSSFRQLQGSRLLPMFLTGIGTFAAAVLGTLSGQSSLLTVLLAGVLGVLYGLVLLFSDDASWIGLRCVVTFLIASAFPDHGWHAFMRGSFVLLGGVLQAGCLIAFRRGPGRSLRDELRSCDPRRVLGILWRDIAPTLVRHVDHRLPAMRYAARLGITLVVAVSLSHLLHQLNRYWLPLTTLIVMKPDFYRTYTGALGRVFGTFLGVALASFLTYALHPGEILLCGFALVFAWNTFAWQKVNYAIFTCALTAFIVFLIATAGLPQVMVTVNRLLDTALGSLIALGSRALGPAWDSVPGVTAPPAAHESKAGD